VSTQHEDLPHLPSVEEMHDRLIAAYGGSGGFDWPEGWRPGALWAPPRSVYPPFNRHRRIGVYDLKTDRAAALMDAVQGIELGAYDVDIIGWLAGGDTPTAATLVSLLHRARLGGPIPGRSASAGGTR